jgi:hypothetical protein
MGNPDAVAKGETHLVSPQNCLVALTFAARPIPPPGVRRWPLGPAHGRPRSRQGDAAVIGACRCPSVLRTGEMMPNYIAILSSLLVGLAATLGTIVIHGFGVHIIVMTLRSNLQRGVLGVRIWVNMTFIVVRPCHRKVLATIRLTLRLPRPSCRERWSGLLPPSAEWVRRPSRAAQRAPRRPAPFAVFILGMVSSA